MARWIFKRREKLAGPFSETELRQFLLTASLEPGDMVQRDGATWRDAATVRQLFRDLDAFGWKVRTSEGTIGPFTPRRVLEKLADGTISDRSETRQGPTGLWLLLRDALPTIRKLQEIAEQQVEANTALRHQISENTSITHAQQQAPTSNQPNEAFVAGKVSNTPAKDEWFLREGSQVSGPFNRDQITKKLFASDHELVAEICDRTGVWRDAEDVALSLKQNFILDRRVRELVPTEIAKQTDGSNQMLSAGKKHVTNHDGEILNPRASAGTKKPVPVNCQTQLVETPTHAEPTVSDIDTPHLRMLQLWSSFLRRNPVLLSSKLWLVGMAAILFLGLGWTQLGGQHKDGVFVVDGLAATILSNATSQGEPTKADTRGDAGGALEPVSPSSKVAAGLPKIKVKSEEEWETEKAVANDQRLRDSNINEAFNFLYPLSLGNYRRSLKSDEDRRLFESNKKAVEQIIEKAVRTHLAESPGQVAANAKEAYDRYQVASIMARRGELPGGSDAIPAALSSSLDEYELHPHLIAIQSQSQRWIEAAKE